MNENKFCVVIPCYKVKNEILTVLKKINFKFVKHVIVVDDFCPQKSGIKAKKKFNNKKKFSYILLKENLGVGGATIIGIKKAIKKKYKYIVKIDGDGQHDNRMIENFYKAFISKKYINCCKGYRELNIRKLKGMPFIRFIGNIFMTIIFRLVSGRFNIRDVSNGLIAFESKIIKKINLNKIKKNFFFEQDLLFKLLEIKAEIFQIKTNIIYRNEISNLKPLAVIFPFLIYYLQILLNKLLSKKFIM